MSMEVGSIIGMCGGALGLFSVVFTAGKLVAQNSATADAAKRLQREIEKLTATVIRLEALCPQCRKSGKRQTVEDSQEE